MTRNVGRNDPCPCGSGKKYKKCCLRTQREAAAAPSEAGPLPLGKFRFEAGSYGQAGAGFAPAALCRKLVAGGEWVPHFVLANPLTACDSQGEAARRAARDLDLAFAEKARKGTEEAMALMLRDLGYMSVDGYQLVDFQPTEPGGWDPGVEDEDLDESERARAAILQVVEEQVRDGDPPETRRTLRRLIGMGHKESEAKKLIGAVLSIEIFGVLKHQEEFDEKRYVEALRRLPELPESLRDE